MRLLPNGTWVTCDFAENGSAHLIAAQDAVWHNYCFPCSVCHVGIVHATRAKPGHRRCKQCEAFARKVAASLEVTE